MSWRPENWENPHKDTFTNHKSQWEQERAYEAGADAMLEAKDKATRDKILELDEKAGDDKAFRCMILAYFILDEG